MRKTLRNAGEFLVNFRWSICFTISGAAVTAATVVLSLIDRAVSAGDSKEILFLFVEYSFIAAGLIILIAGLTKLGFHILGRIFISIANYRLPKKTANITFSVPTDGFSMVSKNIKEVSFQIDNNEKKDFCDIEIILKKIDIVPDRFGKRPISEDELERKSRILHGMRNDKRALKYKDGGNVLSGRVCCSKESPVNFYLFQWDEYGNFFIPNMKLELGSFQYGYGEYKFEFKVDGYLGISNKVIPRSLFVIVKYIDKNNFSARVENDIWFW